MSATKAIDYLSESNPTWLQPVSYDLDGFRRFSQELDLCLADLERQFATRHQSPAVRESTPEPQGCDVDQTGQSQLPSA